MSLFTFPELHPPICRESADRLGQLMANSWLQKKLNRRRRFEEHVAYINKMCPFIADGPDIHTSLRLQDGLPGTILDVGVGDGMFLELCLQRGWRALGVDASSGDGGMGDDYLEACKLICERQGIYVDYVGLFEALDKFKLDGLLALVNMRGSIEQCFSSLMAGEPHHKHQDCKQLAWVIEGSTISRLRQMCKTYHQWLLPGGKVCIHANGSKNHLEFAAILRELAWKSEFDVAWSAKDERVLVFTKAS